jgi:hypothetical protein
MLSYVRGLTTPRIILWCYLVWYGVVLYRYFDPSPALWFNSLGISAIIGTALYLSTAYGGATRTRLGRWQVFRLYLMPFCVSSFAALIKGRGFVLVFHPSWRDNLIALSLASTLVLSVRLVQRLSCARVPRARPADHASLEATRARTIARSSSTS